MKRVFKPCIAFALLIPILMSCGIGKQQVAASRASGTNEQVTVFKSINLVSMTDEKIVKDQTVLVKGKMIIEIGSSRNIKIPENAIVIDGAGAYLMPGLADMHMHTRDDFTYSPIALKAALDFSIPPFFFLPPLLPRIPPLRKSPAPRTNPKLYQDPLLCTS